MAVQSTAGCADPRPRVHRVSLARRARGCHAAAQRSQVLADASQRGRWEAMLVENGVPVQHIGFFESEVSAALVVDAVVRDENRRDGGTRALNFPGPC